MVTAFLLTLGSVAQAVEIIKYQGSNAVVKKEVNDFNERTTPADQSTLDELAKKREEMDEKRKEVYWKFKEVQFQYSTAWAIADTEIAIAKGISDLKLLDSSILLAFSSMGDLFMGEFKSAAEKAFNATAGTGNSILGAIKTAGNAAMSKFKRDGQIVYETITSLEHMVDKFQEQVDEDYANTKVGEAMYGYIKEMRKLAEEYNDYTEQYISIGKNLKGDIYIYTDPSGRKTFFSYDGKNAKTVAGATRGCIPLPMKLAEGKSCIFCPLFLTIFNAAQTMATQSYAVLAKSIATVLLVGLAIWIAFSVMVKISSFTKMDAPKFITEILLQAFKVLLAFVILNNASFIYVYAIGPLLKAGMEFGMSLLFEKGSAYLGACTGISEASLVGSGLLPGYLYTQLECFIQAVQAELAVPQAIGSSLMCVSRNAGSQDLGAISAAINVRMPDFAMMFQGLIIWGFAWLVSLAFAFYLIDATVRLGIVGALMPFLIASWPFKATSKYTSQGWTMFMNTFFTFVFMGLVVSVNIQLMGQSMTGAQGGFSAIEAALNSDKVSELKDLLDIGFAGFLILIASCIFGFKLTSQATELAGGMAGGGGGSPIGANIGGLAGSVAKAGVQGVGNMAWGATKIAGNASGITPKLMQAKDAVKTGVGKALGFGKSSGVAGGSAKITPPASPAQAANAGAFTIGGNPTQAQKVQNADPRKPVNPNDPKNKQQQNQQQQNQQQQKQNQQNQQQQNQQQKPGGNQNTQPLTPQQVEAQKQAAVQEFNGTNVGKNLDKTTSDVKGQHDNSQQMASHFANQANEARVGAENARKNVMGAADEKKAELLKLAAELDKKALDNDARSKQSLAKAVEQQAKLEALERLKAQTAQQYANHKVTPNEQNKPVDEAAVMKKTSDILTGRGK